MRTDAQTILYGAAILALIGVAVFAFVWSFQLSVIKFQSSETKTLTVIAEGEVEVKPNQAIISAALVTESQTAEATQKESNLKVQALINFLKEQGLEGQNVKTTDYYLSPNYIYSQNQKPQLSGYTLTQGLSVRLTDLNQLSSVIGSLTAKGVNRIYGLSFEIDKIQQYKNDARAKAIEEAKLQAALIAKNLGVQLGRVLSYSEGLRAPALVDSYPPKFALEGLGGDGVTLQTGAQTVKVSATLVFEIK